MTDNNDNNGIKIFLNCLIISVRDFNNVPCSEVHQMITIITSRPVANLINAIRARLEVADTQISIYQIHPGSIQEKKMDPALLISKFFKQQPQAEFFHVTVYSR